MDPMTVGAAVTAGHHAISLLKGIAETIKASGKAEAIQDVIDLQMAMLEILGKQQDLTLQNAELQGRIKELEAEAALGRELSFDGRVYWRTRPGTNASEGPFCPTCFDGEKKLVHLLPTARDAGHYCNVCSRFEIYGVRVQRCGIGAALV